MFPKFSGGIKNTDDAHIAYLRKRGVFFGEEGSSGSLNVFGEAFVAVDPGFESFPCLLSYMFWIIEYTFQNGIW